ncbi:2-oxoglutarate and iron-dependent oxygenase JMJD4 homolog [Condylostylus longicornis]|uniref:2-oxoglutarate and iron-dependent oxygenase JMJD4 homolog n=1 Tax=Condylostylus longicornis TaxID=2530218 RepID=UPI00244DF371|nr:2-oxoglutarate and iron-dependent oxygenase JMJD4 homolog [Condylostylus longicornis]
MGKNLLELNQTVTNFKQSVINPKDIVEISRLPNESISYSEFYSNYMQNNIPVIFTNVSNEWECRRNWIAINLENKYDLNIDYLKQHIGRVRVPVVDCSKKYFNSHEKFEMDFFEYLEYWSSRTNSLNIKCLYLKDWHLKSQMPYYNFYRTPEYFASDWLNQYLIDKEKDDYRFVYIGPQGSWTPFHSDVFQSYSWSTNIFGMKKWILLPPGEELKLQDGLGNLPFEIDENLLTQRNCKYFTIIQNENEAIFVPSGWYHQVWNITDTISINHNWFNSSNIEKIWFSLSENMKKVIKEIQDCVTMDDFKEHCQLMLQASFGMNYFDFLDLLEYIEKKSLNAVFFRDENNHNAITFDSYKLNSQHFYIDLRSIRHVVKLMKLDPIIREDMEFLNRCLHLENETHLFDGVVE